MGKEILLNAIQNKNTDRIPWVPFVGVHGAALLGKSAEEYLKSPDLIYQGITEAIKRYRPDGIPVMFDLQIEAEALGCQLQWSNDNPPAVISHILETKEIKDLSLPNDKSGRIPIVVNVIQRLKKQNLDIGLYGLVTGPFTLALHLRGTNIFMDMYDKPDYVNELMSFCSEVVSKVSEIYIDAGCDIIALVDPMTSQISPETFREFVSPYVKKCFDFIRSKKAYSSFFVCGHAQKNIEAMCETKPDNISIDENISLDYVRDICAKNNISYGGNMQLTLILLMGTEDDVKRHTIECLEIGKSNGYILAPGCDLPYGIPPKNLETVADLVLDKYKQEIAKELLLHKKDIKPTINLSEYGQIDKVIVDVITLDSQSCAPCQYMVEAVKAAVSHFGDLVIRREHTIKEKSSIEFMMALMVKNIPTICIDGMIKFVSIIPSQTELINAIQDRINEKIFSKIRRNKNKILLFGSGCEACEKVWQNIQQAKKEIGSDIEVVKISDEEKYIEYGIAKTPAIAIEHIKIKSTGKIPSVEIIKEWIKET